MDFDKHAHISHHIDILLSQSKVLQKKIDDELKQWHNVFKFADFTWRNFWHSYRSKKAIKNCRDILDKTNKMLDKLKEIQDEMAGLLDMLKTNTAC